MQVRVTGMSGVSLATTLLAFLFAAPPSLAQGCKPLTITERGDAPDNPSPAPLYPRITIEAPGLYCLGRDVHQAALRDLLRRNQVQARFEAMIRIRAHDVALDLGGHAVSNGMPNGMTLIWFSKFAAAEPGGTRLTRASIVNGNLSSKGSAGIGIDLTASRFYGSHSLQAAPIPAGVAVDEFFEDTGHLIENVRIHAGKRAILIDGKNNVIRNNRITVDAATAIVAQGPGVVIEDNVIEVRNDLADFSDNDRRAEAQTAFVIRLIQADGAIVRNNVIRLLDRAGRSSLPAAIELIETTGAVVEGNVFGGMDTPVKADAASSFRDLLNSIETCPAGATRFLPLEEAGTVGQPRAPACR